MRGHSQRRQKARGIRKRAAFENARRVEVDRFGQRTVVIRYRWTVVDGGRIRAVHLMDGIGRRTMVICYKWTEVDGGRTRTVHLMDGFGRRTIKILKMWTEVDGWTDGRKSVRGGLLHSIKSSSCD